jgi:photosystem II stability/assembly factor-like uncharacterized protein
MKKFLLVCLIFFSSILNAQWVQKHSDLYDYYNSIYFLDSLNGFVGSYQYSGPYFILRTTDGGDNWTQVDLDGIPFSLSFANDNLGLCAAYNGIYKTTDKGSSWNLNYQDNDRHFSSVDCINNNVFCAVGYTAVSNDLYFYKTIDDGANWSSSFIGTDLSDSKIEMLNENVGFIIASSKIFKTNDGGDNWQIVYQDSSTAHPFWAISFADELNGFAAGTGTGLLSTTDGGDTWHKKFIPLLFCMSIKSLDNNCWAAGFGIGYNAVVYSNDYGETWTPIFVGDSLAIEDIFFSDLNNGWFCADNFTTAPFYNGYIYTIENDWLSQITAPLTPQLIHPAYSVNFEQTLVDFEWEKLENSLYRFQLSTDSLFSSFYVIVNSSNGDTTFYGNNLYIKNLKQVPCLLNQKYYWRVRSENLNGVSDWSEIRSFTTNSTTSVADQTIPDKITLHQNYPNPFNPTTTINYDLDSKQFITLKVYDVLGNVVVTLVNEEKPAGSYEVDFNALNVSSGVYFYKLTSGNFIETKKMVLLK